MKTIDSELKELSLEESKNINGGNPLIAAAAAFGGVGVGFLVGLGLCYVAYRYIL